MIQEGLTNIKKYAAAENVYVAVQLKEAIMLTIKDDGKGFDLVRTKKGMGLNNIITRAELYNGKVDIHTGNGQGCTLKVQIPYSASEIVKEIKGINSREVAA
jgi:signal transduction histidine kinase